MQQPSYPPQHGYPPMGPPPAPKKSNAGVILLVVGIIVAVVLIFGGIFAVLAIHGVRKYIANAKTAEARNTLTYLARSASDAYARDGKFCPSASRPVPVTMSKVAGKKYLASSAEWSVDASKKAGFSCLGFEMATPQYFQYEYTATGDSFTVRAHGDLNGDGVSSTFEIGGHVRNGAVSLDGLVENHPEE